MRGGDRGGAVEDHDVIAQAVEEEGGGEADSRGAACYEDCFVGEVSKVGGGDGERLGAGHDEEKCRDQKLAPVKLTRIDCC